MNGAANSYVGICIKKEPLPREHSKAPDASRHISPNVQNPRNVGLPKSVLVSPCSSTAYGPMEFAWCSWRKNSQAINDRNSFSSKFGGNSPPFHHLVNSSCLFFFNCAASLWIRIVLQWCLTWLVPLAFQCWVDSVVIPLISLIAWKSAK